MIRFFVIFILFLKLPINAQDPLHFVIGKDEFDGINLFSLIQDDTNTVWLSSNKGIHSYDGVSYKRYTPKDSKSNSFFGLTKNSNGVIFFFNLNGQIYNISNNTITLYYTIPPEYLRGDIDITFDEKDNLLIRVSDILLTLCPEKKIIKVAKKKGYFLTKSNNVVYYGEVVNNNLKVIARKNNKEKKVTSYSIKQYPNISFSRKYVIDGKIYGYNNIKAKFFKLKKDSIINYKLPFLKSKNYRVYKTEKNLWFADYKNGIYKVPHTQIENLKNNAKKLFSKYYVSGVMTDSEENTWLITFKKGVIIIPKTTINNNSFTLKNKILKGIHKNANTLYVGSSDEEIYKFKKGEFKKVKQLKNNKLEYFSLHNKNDVIVTNSNIHKNNKNTHRLSFCRKSLLLNDTLLYTADARSLSLFNLNSNKKQAIILKRTYDIVYDKKEQTLWASTNVGLYQYKNEIKTPFLINKKPLLARKLLNVNGKIWATTNTGIYIINKDSIVNIFTEKNGLLSNKVNTIKYEKPNVYIASQKGIQKYNTTDNSFANITKSDGLIKNIANFEVLNDTIYTISDDKLTYFKFKDIKSKTSKYQTSITQAIANGNKKITNNIKLNPEENNLEFSFLTTSFKYRKEIFYKYQLKGYESKPTKTRFGQNFVKYPRLPPGTYTFWVRSYIGNHKNSDASIKFTIREKWYHRLTFRLMVITGILSMFYFIYKSRINAITRKRDKEVLQKRLAQSSLTSLKAQMNPHFLFNAMNSIQTLILKKENKDAYEYLTQLSDLVRENLKMSDVSFVHFYDELQLINKYLELEKLRFKETLTYTIENQLANDDFYIPSMLIQPFIENAIKHGLLHKKTNRVLAINFTKNDDSTILCTITDNGIGRVASNELNKNRNYKSFSTNAINKRFSVLNEYFKLDISFKYEDLYKGDTALGTKVTITLPFSNDKFE